MQKEPTPVPPSRRVLLVDDEERFRTQMARLLEVRGFRTITAGNGREALDIIKDNSFDAVVLDIRMPIMDGMEALAAIKANTPSPAAIMLTGHASLESGIEAIRQGAFDYLIKPCSIEDLVAKLSVACKAQQIQRQPILWPRSLAGELILTAFRRIENTDPLLEAFSIFNHRLTKMAGETLFIVDRENRLVGHLSKQEIMARTGETGAPPGITWEQLSANPQWLPDLSIGEVMQGNTISTAPDTPLNIVARIMIDNNHRTMPVVDNNRHVLGVIRLKDVLVYMEDADARNDESTKEA